MLNPMLLRPTTRGIFCVLAAGATFSASDMLIKTLSGVYPRHQIVLMRAIVAVWIIETPDYRNIVSTCRGRGDFRF